MIEYKTAVPINKDDDMDGILLKFEQTEFLKETRIDQIRPDHNILFTEPGRYSSVRQHIAFHKYLKEREFNQEISEEEAVASWYDTVYRPIIYLIHEKELLNHFPRRTEADLYAWLLLHRAALEEEMEAPGYIPNEDVIEGVKAEHDANPIIRILSFFQDRVKRQHLPLKVERAKFLDETHLDETQPNHNLNFTELGCYQLAKEHIWVHKYLRETEEQIELSFAEAAASWYIRVYWPIVKLVRERGVLTYFPGNTEADLYIWLVSRRAALEEEKAEMGHVSNENIVADLEEEGRAGSWTRWIPIFRRKLDLQGLLPD